MSTCHQEVKRKAIKNHRCSWCNELIEKNSEYFFQSGIGYDGPYSSKLHQECKKAIDSIPSQDWEDYEELWGHAARGHIHETGWGIEKKCPGCQDGLPQDLKQ